MLSANSTPAYFKNVKSRAYVVELLMRRGLFQGNWKCGMFAVGISRKTMAPIFFEKNLVLQSGSSFMADAAYYSSSTAPSLQEAICQRREREVCTSILAVQVDFPSCDDIESKYACGARIYIYLVYIYRVGNAPV